MNMKIVDTDKWFEFPQDVAKCPICDAPVVAWIDEWDSETGEVTEGGFHVDCKDEPDETKEYEWECWFSSHWSMPYVDWLPLEQRLYRWFNKRYRVKVSERETL